MPSLRRIARHRNNNWGMGHVSQLAYGFDFFGDGWGAPSKLPMDQREGWPSEELLADMAACYGRHRDEVEAKGRHGVPTWASLVFDQGMSADEAHKIRQQYRDSQHALRRAQQCQS